ncbi:extracellular metalloproteinase 1 [Batrachochytrium salamandrivorans]|nr:extracellular metalloproteinase 1 [Batrachochytrium salamandrivorans]
MVLAKESDTATTGMPIGAYISDSAVGFRSHLYTTDMTVNPLTYGNLKFAGGAYAVGVVWASMLWQVYWNLVEKHGFSTNLYDAKQSAGNVVAMKIFIGGLTLQPCNPGLLGARNAIIDADKLHYNGTPQVRDLQGICQAWPRLQDHQGLHR